MRIERLSLRNFRRFRQAEFRLGEGINVVKGPNESGKSTLVQALLAVLFWKADSMRKEVRDSVTWGEREGFRLELEGEAEGRSFRLVKDFSARKASLEWGDLETVDAAEIEGMIGEWLGLGSEMAFRSTAGIRQDEVSDMAAGRRELSDSLQVTVTGSEGGKSALEARASLQKELAALQRGIRSPAKNLGPLARVEREIEEKTARRGELSRLVEARKSARRRMEEIDEERGRLQDRLGALEELVKDSAERADIEEDIGDFHRRFASLEGASALIEEEEQLRKLEMERYGDLKAVLEGSSERLGELELKRAGITEGLNILHERMTKEEQEARYRPWAPYLLTIGLTLLLTGIAGMMLTPYLLVLSGVGAAAAAAALFPGGYVRFLGRGRRMAALRDQAEKLKAREREATGEIEGMIADAGCASVSQFNDLKLGYLELLARRKEIADKLEALVPDGDLGGVEQEARLLATEVGLRERRLKELRGKAVEPDRLQELLCERERTRAVLDGLRDEQVRLEVILSDEGVEEEYLRAVEELSYLEERRRRLRMKAEALELAVNWLDESAREILASASRSLEGLVGGYMGRITGGRYTRVYVDEGTFGMRLWSSEKGGEVEAELLSRGTVDQLYLAARLSLLEIICDHRRPPLILDDPFVTFDSRRLRGAMEVMREFAGEWQVVIFTCGDHYDEFAERVVELNPVQP